jgi:hypothetical protein
MLFVTPDAARANWTVLSGRTVSAPTAVWSPDTNHVYVVVVGSYDELWFAAVDQNKVITTPFTNIAGSRPLPPALVWDPVLHKIDILVLSPDNNLWFAALNTDGTLYEKWKELSGILASPPSLVWNPLLNKIDILGRSSDNRLWFATLDSGGNFTKEWTSVPGTTPSSPAAAWDSSLQKIQVLVRSSNDTLWFGTLNSDGSVSKTFTNISGNTISAPALIFDSRGNRLYAFVRGGNNEVWFSRFDSSGKTVPVWRAISGRLLQPPAVALNPNNGMAFIVASMPYDYAAGAYTYVDDFPVNGVAAKAPIAAVLPSSAADKTAVKDELDSGWWRNFYSFNYQDVQSRQGGNNPAGFFLESLTKAYAPSYFARTGGALVKLWLSTGDFERAQEVLQYTLDVTKRSGLNRVPHYVLTSGEPEMTDQMDGQASIILAWALYAREVNAPAFVNSSYGDVAALMDATMAQPYFTPSFGLVRNLHLEHYREERFWDTYDIFTQAFVAQSLREMIRVANSRGDAAHAKRWENDKNILERAIARRMTWKLDGRSVYAEMFEDKSTTQIYPGLSEFSFGPTAAGWEGVDPKIYDQTVAALMQYGSFVWNGHRVISIGFTKDMHPAPITSGKVLAWQMLFFAQKGDWNQVAATLAFVKDEQQQNNEPRVFEASQVNVPPPAVNVFNGPGNGEQTVWMLYALHEIAKLAGAKAL